MPTVASSSSQMKDCISDSKRFRSSIDRFIQMSEGETIDHHVRCFYYDHFSKEMRDRLIVTVGVALLLLSAISLVGVENSRHALMDIITHESSYRAFRCNERARVYKELFQKQNSVARSKYYAGTYFEDAYHLFELASRGELPETTNDMLINKFAHSSEPTHNDLHRHHASQRMKQCLDGARYTEIKKENQNTDAILSELKKLCQPYGFEFSLRQRDIPAERDHFNILHPTHKEVPLLLLKFLEWTDTISDEYQHTPIRERVFAVSHVLFNLLKIHPFNTHAEHELLFNYIVRTKFNLRQVPLPNQSRLEVQLVNDFQSYLEGHSPGNAVPLMYKLIFLSQNLE